MDATETINPSDFNIESVYEIPVEIMVVLGRTSMTISQLLKLSRGSVVELDRAIGEAIDIYVNGKIVAKASFASVSTIKAMATLSSLRVLRSELLIIGSG